MPRYKIDFRAMQKRSVDRAAALKIGGVYFLSSFYDKTGANVKVLARGQGGLVMVEVVEPIGEPGSFYAAGTIHQSVNASNLYANRADASHAAKFGPDPAAGARKLMSALTGLSTERIDAICKDAPSAKPMNAAQKAWATRRARKAGQ
jgi:hypothetical protein